MCAQSKHFRSFWKISCIENCQDSIRSHGLRSDVVTSPLAKTTKTWLEALSKLIESRLLFRRRLIPIESEYFMKIVLVLSHIYGLLKMTSAQNFCRCYVVDTYNWQLEEPNRVYTQIEQCWCRQWYKQGYNDGRSKHWKKIWKNDDEMRHLMHSKWFGIQCVRWSRNWILHENKSKWIHNGFNNCRVSFSFFLFPMR